MVGSHIIKNLSWKTVLGAQRLSRVERPCGEPLAGRMAARPAETCSASYFSCWSSKCLVKYPVKQFSSSPSPSLSQFLHKAGHLMLWWGCGKNSPCDSKSDIPETCLISVAVNPDSCPISELPLQASNPFLILPFLSTSPFLTFVLFLTLTVSLILSLCLSLSIRESWRRVAFSQRPKPFASHFSG